MNNAMGNFTVCDFYISDTEDRSGISFRMAYEAAKKSKNNKELCACWGSMVCAVSEGRLRASVENALNRIGVRPREVKLPSEAGKYNINVSDVHEMDWPSILVSFGCCIILLYKSNWTDEAMYYKRFMSGYIRELQKRIGYDPATASTDDVDVPFDFKRSKVIETMLGVNSTLKRTVVGYTMYIEKHQQSSRFKNWHFNIVNEMLVKPRSPVLENPLVSEEAKNLKEAYEVVRSHPHPQFFRLTASAAELWKVDCSGFMNIIAVAKELKRGGDGSSVALDPHGRINRTTVQALVKLHQTAMACKTEA